MDSAWTPLGFVGLALASDVYETFGGPGRDRTDDLFHAMEARSQLRYRPTVWMVCDDFRLPGRDSQTSSVNLTLSE